MTTDRPDIAEGATTEGLPVAPSMAPALAAIHAPTQSSVVSGRTLFLSGVSLAIGIAAGGIAALLTRLIGLITNVAFYGRLSTALVSPAETHLGLLVVLVTVAGGGVVGLMAYWGSPAIRGHGIPEAMEQVLYNESRIPARLLVLKPLSAAISIGTGGPFGAEGPIIATGGALGSLVGQVLTITADERKTLLAAGAAAGMTATFGCPVSAVLLAIELLLFEYRARSLVPVALAAVAGTAVRLALVGAAPMFAVPDLPEPGGAALAAYVLLGALVGVVSVGVTRLVYATEDAFARLPVHWMWWPALGGIAVGVIGVVAPRTLGVGYENIEQIVSGGVLGKALAVLVVLKFASWCIALGSGTSGGTLAPLFTIGAGVGAGIGIAMAAIAPGAAVHLPTAALVGMAAMFAGASRALLASIVFAFETTRQPMGLLPLLGGCTAAYLVSCLLMQHSIMTEKIARRGARVGSEYAVDFLDQVLVRDAMAAPAITLAADEPLERVTAWISAGGSHATHQGFPVVDAAGSLVGVLTRRELLDPGVPPGLRVRDLVRRPPAVAFADNSLREAADHMVGEGIGRLPVVERAAPRRVVGMLTRSDVLAAHRERIEAAQRRAERAFPRPRSAA